METITGLGLLAFGFAFIWMQWRSGSSKASVEVIQTYKEQVEQMRGEIKELTDKVGQLTGQLSEKDKQVSMMQAILQNRNPELDTFMKDVANVSAKSMRIQETNNKILKDVHKLLQMVYKAHSGIGR